MNPLFPLEFEGHQSRFHYHTQYLDAHTIRDQDQLLLNYSDGHRAGDNRWNTFILLWVASVSSLMYKQSTTNVFIKMNFTESFYLLLQIANSQWDSRRKRWGPVRTQDGLSRLSEAQECVWYALWRAQRSVEQIALVSYWVSILFQKHDPDEKLS